MCNQNIITLKLKCQKKSDRKEWNEDMVLLALLLNPKLNVTISSHYAGLHITEIYN